MEERGWELPTDFAGLESLCGEIREAGLLPGVVGTQLTGGPFSTVFNLAKTSWLTGTAAWTFANISQYILGVYPTHSGLQINPCVPKGFGDFKLTREYRGAVYHIQVLNPQDVEKGVISMTVDGTAVEGNIIPCPKDQKEVNVVVTMG